MINLKINIQKTLGFISENEINSCQNDMNKYHSDLLNKTGKGNDFLGWVDLPSSISEVELSDISSSAKSISKNADLIVVIGIGGGFLFFQNKQKRGIGDEKLDVKLINYIKLELTKKVPKDKIKDALISQGWTKEDIDKAFKQIKG